MPKRKTLEADELEGQIAFLEKAGKIGNRMKRGEKALRRRNPF